MITFTGSQEEYKIKGHVDWMNQSIIMNRKKNDLVKCNKCTCVYPKYKIVNTLLLTCDYQEKCSYD